MYEAFQETVEFLRKKDVKSPEVGIVLGTAAASLGAKQLRELIKAARALEPAPT